MRNKFINFHNTLLLLFIIFHISAVLYWNVYWTNSWDKNEDQTIFNTVRYYMHPLGLWQNWDVFAPPPQVETHILIQGNADGFLANYTPAYQTNPTRINHDKERKWHENMLSNDFSRFRTLYLEYWCGQFELEYDTDFTEVTLFLYHQEIPMLDAERQPSKNFVKKWSVEC